MKTLGIALGILATLALLLLLVGQLGGLTGKPAANLGVRNGRLAPPSATPNSVSSQAGLHPDHPQRAYASIEPLPFTGEPAAAMARLRRVVEALPRTVVVEAQGDYLYAQSRTRWLNFTDDVEFWIDAPNQRIEVRSASRLGQKDMGANRARVEAVRAAWLAAQVGEAPKP